MLEFLRRHQTGLRLFALAFLTLYLELALIRFTSAKVLYLGFFANFVLLAAFLGIGLGFLAAERKTRLLRYVPQALLFLIAFVLVAEINATALREAAGQIFFANSRSTIVLPPIVCLPVVFGLVTFLFAAVAQETARCFPAYKPLVAYSIDIAGSLAGIVAFTVHSFFGGTPIAWFLVVCVLLVALSDRRRLLHGACLGVGMFLLLAASRSSHYEKWSSYQWIEVTPIGEAAEPEGWYLTANGIGHQSMQRVGTKEAIYDFPYTELVDLRGGKKIEDVLVIGAGGGTDVSYALHYGVEHVDAVEIDREILKAGRKFHPDRPYDDPRVEVFVDDGRAFMERTDRKYDLVVYALTDSIASLSNLSNIRLESFLFTEESFARAKELLKDDGAVVLYNYYRREWLVDKLGTMMTNVFGHEPVVRSYTDDRGGRLAVLAVGPHVQGKATAALAEVPATDDWPFLYLRTPQVPTMYVWAIVVFLSCGIGAVLLSGGASPRSIGANGPFLLMGAAFLLLETKSVIQFSLLFGATWLVNSLVFFAVLASVLLANLVVAVWNPKRPGLLFGLLFLAIAVQFALPLRTLLAIEWTALRYVAGSLVLFAPIFFANLVFGYLFKDTPKSTAAFGWNVVGTVIGGALEYTSLAIGYQSLTLAVLGLYGACAVWAWFITRPQAETATEPAANLATAV